MKNHTLIAKRLKECRESKGKTLEDIGNLVGVHKSTVLRWENGSTSKITHPTIELLAKYYDVNPAWLMGESEEKEQEALDYESAAKLLKDPDRSEMLKLLLELPEDSRKAAMDYIRYLQEKQDKS